MNTINTEYMEITGFNTYPAPLYSVLLLPLCLLPVCFVLTLNLLNLLNPLNLQRPYFTVKALSIINSRLFLCALVSSFIEMPVVSLVFIFFNE